MPEIRSPSKSPFQKRTRVTENFQFGGVKKLFIIAIASDVPENYDNLKTLLGTLGQKNINYTMAMDLKCTNLVVGLQAHGAKHPCHFCEASQPFNNECAPLRTIGGIKVVLHSKSLSYIRLLLELPCE